MGRMDSPPWARGETYANGDSYILNGAATPFGLGGINLQGKEFIFEPNSQDDEAGVYANLGPDPCGRPIKVKVVRNVSGQSLLPGRIVRYATATTFTPAGVPYETQVDGYVTSVADRPAGIVDEFLPAAGVPNSDLFYIVVDGPSLCMTGNSTSPVVNIGDHIVPAAYGSSAGDTLGGRFAKADYSGATTPLAENILHQIGFAASAIAATTVINTQVPIIVELVGGD